MRTNNIYNILFSVFVSIFLSIIAAIYSGCGDNTTTVVTNCSGDPDSIPDSTKGTAWTIMVYADGDNDLENALLLDIVEMKAGFVNNQGINLIVLVDRKDGVFCDGFSEKFTDTRLYQISHNKAKRISGSTQFPQITTTSNYEANMGDANTLKKFIQFCKINYPATNDALILWNHGGGPKGLDSLTEDEIKADKLPFKSVCSDDTDNDILYTAEITDILESTDSVKLLGFDACIMGSVEIAYQYRPGNGGFNAQVMVASPANEWGYGWKYDKIFERLKAGGGNNGESCYIAGGNELYYDPSTTADVSIRLTALRLGEVIVEEQYDSTTSRTDQTLSCYDLTKVGAVKTAVDTLAQSLTSPTDKKSELEAIRGSGSSPTTMHYFNASDGDEWVAFPSFDLYDLCQRINVDTANFDGTMRTNASSVMSAVHNMLIYSFAGSAYTCYSGAFQPGNNGVYIFSPNGDANNYSLTNRDWVYQWWYNPRDTNIYYAPGFLYGKLAWCMGATSGNSTIENWFEMLDKWFDTEDGFGGYNSYIY